MIFYAFTMMPCPCLKNLTNSLHWNHHQLAIPACTWAPNSSLHKWVMEFMRRAWVPQNTSRKLSLIVRSTWNQTMTAGMSCWPRLLTPLSWDMSLNYMRHLLLTQTGHCIFNPSSACVCVDLASAALDLSHDGLSSHRAVLPVLLGAAVNKG